MDIANCGIGVSRSVDSWASKDFLVSPPLPPLSLPGYRAEVKFARTSLHVLVVNCEINCSFSSRGWDSSRQATGGSICLPRSSIFVLHIVTSARKRLRISHIEAAIYLIKQPPLLYPRLSGSCRGVGMRNRESGSYLERTMSSRFEVNKTPVHIAASDFSWR